MNGGTLFQLKIKGGQKNSERSIVLKKRIGGTLWDFYHPIGCNQRKLKLAKEGTH